MSFNLDPNLLFFLYVHVHLTIMLSFVVLLIHKLNFKAKVLKPNLLLPLLRLVQTNLDEQSLANMEEEAGACG